MVVVNNGNQSKWAMVNTLWLVKNAKKTNRSDFTIAHLD